MRRTIADVADDVDTPDEADARMVPAGLRKSMNRKELQTPRAADPEVPDWSAGDDN